MDREHFDALARLVSSRQSRRGALAALVGAALLGHHPDADAARRRPRRRKGRKGRPGNGDDDNGSVDCYPGTNCIPGNGHTNGGCDFSFSTVFRHLDARGSILSGANFTGADASGADFGSAVLSDACFVDANLLDANITNSTVLGDAIFCNTVMPDGSINDTGCDRGTDCCPTTCQGENCPPGGGTCVPLNTTCSPFGIVCCTGSNCATLEGGIVGVCAPIKSCTSNADCHSQFPGQDVVCDLGSTLGCLNNPLEHCCSRQSCNGNGDCANSKLCCNEVCCAPGQSCVPVFGCSGSV